jgi:hypothetical protein
MSKIKEVQDGYEYLNSIYPGTRALDLGKITIDADLEQIREARADILVTAVEMDAIQLLDVQDALTQIIHEVKQCLAASASDAAFDCYHEGVLPDERACITKVTFGRKPNLEEVSYWRRMFELEYELVSKEAA